MFQSSTRQTDFATLSSWSAPLGRLSRFNPLRGRQTLQQERGPERRQPLLPRFNPLRGRQTLQPAESVPMIARVSMVSILYEADRLCNEWLEEWIGRVASGFNPLRGRQTLQPELHDSSKSGSFSGFNPLRGRQTLQQEVRVYQGQDGRMFQSSTRQTDFATYPGCPWEKRRQPCFNPLRGRQTLQLPLSGSGSR